MDRVVLDADVIFSRTLHDLLGRVGTTLQRFEVLWSDELLAEAKRSLTSGKNLTPELADQWVGYLTTAFPYGRIDIDANNSLQLETLTSDPGDQHVCALAVLGRASLLITLDQGYDSAALATHGVTVTHPDDFLTTDAKGSEAAYLDALTQQADDWQTGATLHDLLDALERASLPRFTNHMRNYLGDNDH